MKAFVVYPTYRTVKEDGKDVAYVHLFGRLENGESFHSISKFRPYFWIKKSDLAKAKKIGSFDPEEPGFTTYDGKDVVKVVLDIPRQVPDLRKAFEDEGIVCYEADIRFSYRFMMDHHILGSSDISGKHEKGEYVDRIYHDPEFKEASFAPTLKVLSFDIETDKTAKKLFSIALHGDGVSEVMLVHKEKVKHATSYATEKEALQAFVDKVRELDPDIILGWNVIDFDLNVLQQMCRNNGVSFCLGRELKESSLRLSQDFFRESGANLSGRQVLDGIAVLKNSFIRLEDYKLGTAAEFFLGEKKLIGDENKARQIEDAYKNNPQLLVDYNLKDAVLTLQVLEKSGALALTIQRSLLTGMPLERVSASIASLDSLYLRELQKKRIVAPSVVHQEQETQTKGGHVMSSKPGIYEFILVHDFKSLYPSIIRTFNIDPVSYIGMDKKGKDIVKAINGACFRNEDGILPRLIQNLWAQRDKAKKVKNEYASKSIKILMNSFYGVLANPRCRFYNSNIANAITHTGQHLIKLSAEKAREKGYEVIYGDTDSIFTLSGATSLKEAEKIGKGIQDEINVFYEQYIKNEFHRENFMELEFEKVFIKFMMPTVRGSTVGAKKRYAGIVMKDDKEKLEFTGLEFVRSDWTALAKKFQLELLDKIFHEKEVAKYIRTFITDLKKGKYDDLLVYKKSIRKDLKEYVKTTPPHVKAARKLEAAGKKLESTSVHYLMTEQGPEPVQIQKSKIDYEHYIDKQVKPIADSVLSFYDTNFDDVIMNSKQQTLFGF
ncbi:MAG: DNA polymerase II [Nanoarchaeota archaeon]